MPILLALLLALAVYRSIQLQVVVGRTGDQMLTSEAGDVTR